MGANDDKSVILSHEELEALVERGVVRAFTTIGIDTNQPIEMQQDFAFMRSARKTVKRCIKTAQTTAVGLLITGLCTALWLGIRAIFSAAEK